MRLEAYYVMPPCGGIAKVLMGVVEIGPCPALVIKKKDGYPDQVMLYLFSSSKFAGLESDEQLKSELVHHFGGLEKVISMFIGTIKKNQYLN